MRAFTHTDYGPRTKPAAKFAFRVPPGWETMEEYLRHLSYRHGLGFERRNGVERFYSDDEVHEARIACIDSCYDGKGGPRRVQPDTRKPSGPSSKSGRQPKPKPEVDVTGLVTSQQITKRYGQGTSEKARNNFMTRLKKAGLAHQAQKGRSQFYDPADVDTLCKRLELPVITEDTNWS